MNYLAHAFLSGEDTEILLGNFIADSVRGSQLQMFPEKVAQGIVLHRKIDVFTDTHPVVQLSKDKLRPGYGKFAGVITDMFYDHFLAFNFGKFSQVPLQDFAQMVYSTINKYQALLPERVHYFFPYMQEQNWLFNYSNISGIRKSLTGLSRRTSFTSNMETAADELENNYPLYETDFFLFFPELQDYVQEELQKIK